MSENPAGTKVVSPSPPIAIPQEAGTFDVLRSTHHVGITSIIASIVLEFRSTSFYPACTTQNFYSPCWNYSEQCIISPMDDIYRKAPSTSKIPRSIMGEDKSRDVVRITPNELSFATADAYRDIYTPTGDLTFVKSSFYKVSNFSASDIIGESDVTTHANMRRLWAHGFSARALQSHEELEQRYVDLFIRQVRKHGVKAGGINVVDWFNFMTFDIIGELVFGVGFGALETGSSQFWVSVILDNMKAGLYIDVLRRLGFYLGFKKLFELLPFEGVEAMRRHGQITREMAGRRLARPLDDKRVDFLSSMLSEGRKDVITQEEVAAQGQNLVSIAGSETTATTLSALTYFILKHPEVYTKFKQEIRDKFTDYDQISSAAVGQLSYFNAVINETMRLYPPVPFGPPRLSPGAYVDGRWIPKGTEVSVNPWAICRDARYFPSPETFDPERWLDGKNKVTLGAFQPFHLGPRVCLGRNLAYIELRCTLAKLYWSFDAELVNKDVDIERDSRMYILWNKPPINVVFSEKK
ncbi:hypothetical protein B7494_g6162 [Chlorociboria aeruginascens]|nr:hypothetical protein B7494_g6162 [Chlorociboria aeruginascens]